MESGQKGKAKAELHEILGVLQEMDLEMIKNIGQSGVEIPVEETRDTSQNVQDKSGKRNNIEKILVKAMLFPIEQNLLH